MINELKNGKTFLSYGDGLMRLNEKTGELVRGITYVPGLMLWGCNFRGIDASDGIKDILKENGAIVSRNKV